MWGFGDRRGRQEAGALYSKLVAQAREPAFYTDCHVPDTIEGRLELVMLHCHALLRRLKHLGPVGQPAGQELLQYMFDDIDRSIREIGVGDVSIGKYMKRLGKGFYGRAEAYDRALDAGDMPQLTEALKRNVLGTAEGEGAALDHAAAALARYVAALAARLETCSLAALQQPILFPEVAS